MAKKGVKSSASSKKVTKKPAIKSTSKKTVSTPTPKNSKDENIQKILIENFVSFQTVMADLTSKLNSLSTQISDLLNLFEKSAKTFMEKDIKIGGTDKAVTEKLDKLLEQNKVLAQGISLLHEVNTPAEEDGEPEEQYEAPEPERPPTHAEQPRLMPSRMQPRNMQRQQPMPPQPNQPKPLQQDFKEQSGTNYQKSISSQH